MTQPAPPIPRGQRDPESRRRAIIAAAAELIAENGPAGITHRTIAKRAGVSLGSTTKYFASLDELRECALQFLADDIDGHLSEVEALMPQFGAALARIDASSTKKGHNAAKLDEQLQAALAAFVDPVHDFFRDRRAVSADLALISSGAIDPRMRALAQRWSDHLTALLTPHLGRACATAITVYLDGATVHAGIHDEPLRSEELTEVFRALLALRTPTTTAPADPPATPPESQS